MHAKRAIAAAAVAAAANGATAFTTSMGMLHAASLRPSVCVPRHARGLALCMTEKQFAVEVDPAELVDFSGCKSWNDAIRVGREVEAALEHMRADGHEIVAETLAEAIRGVESAAPGAP